MDFNEDVTLISWDYMVLALILLVPVLVSIWYAIKDKNKNTRVEYLLGGRKMNLIPVAMSLFVTFQSAVSLIGCPGEIYTFGTSYLLIYIGISLSYMINAWAVVPLLYPLEVTSIYQYLDMRFHSKTLTGLITGIAATRLICYMAIALLAPALALQASVDVPLWISIVVVGGICTLYTSVGGIKSVIWTDAFQTVIVFFGIFACIAKGSSIVGGFSKAWSIAEEGGRVIFDKFTPDPRVRMTLWGTLIGGIFMWLTMAFDQSSLQRIRSMKSMRQARISTLLNIPFTLMYGALLLNIGIVIFAYFSYIGCDPLKSRAIGSKNQVAPYFVLHSMTDLPGMAGFYLAAIFCGSVSTLSSGINSLAAILVEGMLSSSGYKPTERKATLITKLAVAVVGSVIVGLAYCAQFMRGPVTQMVGSINGSFGSPVVGVFLLAALVPWANKFGAGIGVLLSVGLMLTLTLGGQTLGALPRPLPPAPINNCGPNKTIDAIVNLIYNVSLLNGSMLDESNTTQISVATASPYDPKFFLFDISYEWYSVFGTLFCMAIGLLVSFLSSHLVPKGNQPKPELMFHFCRRFWIRRGYILLSTEELEESAKVLEKAHFENEVEIEADCSHKDTQTESL
ncbi:sodium-coupled monocarboxylate transporter [Plakobranchus ocellatus]|uniref:Sodium-coupled monocarboxylate transporter n=1 Tax=Plakobranchus ocellatus TaxID=259542 RepID=A0AAV4DL70_9GAST|nr:sodium-coupled monocarboxylate transporter [Plakobranchus ocellatus]